MSSVLACFLHQFITLEACSCLKNDRDTVNLVSYIALLILALLSFSLVSHIPYYVNCRFNNGPNISSDLACFLCQFGLKTLKVFLQKYFVCCVQEVCKRF